MFFYFIKLKIKQRVLKNLVNLKNLIKQKHLNKVIEIVLNYFKY